jgi:integrase
VPDVPTAGYGKLVLQWGRDNQNLSKKTRVKYLNVLERFDAFLQVRGLRLAGPGWNHQHVTDFTNGLKSRTGASPAAATTKNNVRAAIMSFVAWGIATVPPAWKQKPFDMRFPPRARGRRLPPDGFTSKEVKDILDAPGEMRRLGKKRPANLHRDRAILALGAHTGARVHEIVERRVGDVFAVRRGRRTGRLCIAGIRDWMQVTGGKGGVDYRPPLPRATHEVLWDYLLGERDRVASGDEFLFPGGSEGHVSTSTAQTVCREAAEFVRAHTGGFHAFRRAAITRWASACKGDIGKLGELRMMTGQSSNKILLMYITGASESEMRRLSEEASLELEEV